MKVGIYFRLFSKISPHHHPPKSRDLWTTPKGGFKKDVLIFLARPGWGGSSFSKFLRTFRDFFFRPKISTFIWFVVELNFKSMNKSDTVKTNIAKISWCSESFLKYYSERAESANVNWKLRNILRELVDALKVFWNITQKELK